MSRPVVLPGFDSPVYSQGIGQHLSFDYHDDAPVQGAKFKIDYAGGQTHEGVFDAQGKADMSGAPAGEGRVQLGEDVRGFVAKAMEANPTHQPTWSDADLVSSLAKGRGDAA